MGNESNGEIIHLPECRKLGISKNRVKKVLRAMRLRRSDKFFCEGTIFLRGGESGSGQVLPGQVVMRM